SEPPARLQSVELEVSEQLEMLCDTRLEGGEEGFESAVAEPLLVPSMTAFRIYTDGSCHPAGTVGGWAWILVDEHAIGSDSGVTLGPSNHQRCEVTAAIEGLTYLVASGIRELSCSPTADTSSAG